MTLEGAHDFQEEVPVHRSAYDGSFRLNAVTGQGVFRWKVPALQVELFSFSEFGMHEQWSARFLPRYVFNVFYHLRKENTTLSRSPIWGIVGCPSFGDAILKERNTGRGREKGCVCVCVCASFSETPFF